MTVGSEIAKLRRLADLGEIALVHKDATRSSEQWSVWEMGWGDRRNERQWCIADGATPRAALKNAVRRVRGQAVRERAQNERGSNERS